MQKQKNLGFTFVESMVAVAITGVLVVLALPMYQTHLAKGQASEAFALMNGAKTDVIESIVKSNSCTPSTGATINGKYGVLTITGVVNSDALLHPKTLLATGCTFSYKLKSKEVSKLIMNQTIVANLFNNGVLSKDAGTSVEVKYLPKQFTTLTSDPVPPPPPPPPPPPVPPSPPVTPPTPPVPPPVPPSPPVTPPPSGGTGSPTPTTPPPVPPPVPLVPPPPPSPPVTPTPTEVTGDLCLGGAVGTSEVKTFNRRILAYSLDNPIITGSSDWIRYWWLAAPFEISLLQTRGGVGLQKYYLLDIPCTDSAKSANIEVNLENGDIFRTTLTYKTKRGSGLYFYDMAQNSFNCKTVSYCDQTMRNNDVRGFIPQIYEPFQNFVSQRVDMNGARMNAIIKVTINY